MILIKVTSIKPVIKTINDDSLTNSPRNGKSSTALNGIRRIPITNNINALLFKK
jgi:hypothetical protein